MKYLKMIICIIGRSLQLENSIMKYKSKQGDIIWLNFSPSFGKEMKGKHPDMVVSSNAFNKKTDVIIVCPITSGENTFSGYVLLNDYKTFGRVNATQIHSFDTDRIINTEFIERLRDEDFLIVKQVLDYPLEVGF